LPRDEGWPDAPIQPARAPNGDTVGQRLDPGRFSDVYRLVLEEGRTYTGLWDGASVHLLLVHPDVEAFDELVDRDLWLGFSQQGSRWIAVVWAEGEAEKPVGFPYTFDVAREADRWLAARLLGQTSAWLHHLAHDGAGALVHIFSERLPLTDAAREEGRRLLAAARAAATEGGEPMWAATTASAAALPDDVLAAEGIGYLVDYGALVEREGEEGAQEALMEAVHRALVVCRRHPRADIREATFSVWVAEGTDGPVAPLRRLVTLFVAPAPDRWDRDATADPFWAMLEADPVFVGRERGRPLAAGAYPIVRYEGGRLVHLELDEEARARLFCLFAVRWPDRPNPYGAGG